MKKRWLVLFSILFVLLFSTTVYAAEPTALESVSGILKEVLAVIADIFMFRWLGNENLMVGFFRFCIWVVTFAVFYFALNAAGLGRIGGIISFFLALISSVFIPPGLIILIASVYSTVVAFGIIFATIFGLMYLIFSIPATGIGWICRFVLSALVILLFITVRTGIIEGETTFDPGVPALGGSALREPGPIQGSTLGAFVSASNWGIGFMALFMLYQIGQLIFGFWGAGSHEGSGRVMRAFNSLFTNGPGGTHHGHGGDGGGGAHGNQEMMTMLREILQHSTQSTQHNQEMRTVTQGIHTAATEIQTMAREILNNTRAIVARLDQWIGFFNATVAPTLERIETAAASGSAGVTQLTANITAIDRNLGTLTQEIQQIRQQAVERTGEMNTKIESVQRQLGEFTPQFAQAIRTINGTNRRVRALEVSVPALNDATRAGAQAQIDRMNETIAAINRTLLDLPTSVTRGLDARLTEVRDALAAVTRPGVDIERLIGRVTAAIEGIQRSITDAQNEIVRDAEANVYGDGTSSLSTRLLREIATLRRNIEGPTTPRRGGVANDIAAMRAQIDLIVRSLAELRGVQIGSARETVVQLQAVQTVDGLAKLGEVTQRVAGAGEQTLTQGAQAVEGAVREAQGHHREEVNHAIRLIEQSLHYNERIYDSLATLHSSIQNATRTEARDALNILGRSLGVFERRAYWRGDTAVDILSELRNLNITEIDTYLEREGRNMLVYEGSKIGSFSDSSAALHALANRNVKLLRIQVDKLISRIRGLVIIQQRLIDMLKRVP